MHVVLLIFCFFLSGDFDPISKIYGQIGAEIFKRALTYPARLIAKNAGVNDSIVIEKVSLLESFSIYIFTVSELILNPGSLFQK